MQKAKADGVVRNVEKSLFAEEPQRRHRRRLGLVG